MKSIQPLILLCIAVLLSNPSVRVRSISICITDTFEVKVTSQLPPDSGQLKLHCASRDDDFGIHYLDLNQTFMWKFCENYFRRTLYFCHLWWGTRQIRFDAFNSKTQGGGHGVSLVVWYAKEDGIYYYDDGTGFPATKKYDWQN